MVPSRSTSPLVIDSRHILFTRFFFFFFPFGREKENRPKQIYVNAGGLPGKCAEVTEAKGSEDVCKGRTIVMDHGT